MASMGPRPEGRGNADAACRGDQARDASMGPRPEGRGNPRPPIPTACSPKCFNGAATRRPRKLDGSGAHSPTDRKLQWGRDPKAAETSGLTTSARPSSAGFNGAATRRPRKPTPTRYPRRRRDRLQWGRDPKAAETPRLSSRSQTTQWCFNGAATRRPRKPPSAGAWWTIKARLQWGRDPKAAETEMEETAAEELVVASMGPRPEGRGNPRARGDQAGGGGGASMGPRPEGRGNWGQCDAW